MWGTQWYASFVDGLSPADVRVQALLVGNLLTARFVRKHKKAKKVMRMIKYLWNAALPAALAILIMHVVVTAASG